MSDVCVSNSYLQEGIPPAFGRSQGAVRERGRHFSVNCKTVSLHVDASLRAGIQLWTGTAGIGGWCMRVLLCETMVSEN